MKILVTGGSGFIGSRLVDALLAAGHEVKIYDHTPSRSHADRCIAGDVCDGPALTAAARGMDCIYHLAAEHKDNVLPRSRYYDVNVGGAHNVVAAATAAGIERIVFTSTVALYGLNVGRPNENSPIQAFNDYGKSKYEAELVFRKWIEEDPAKRTCIIVRPAVIFGERNRGNVYTLLSQLASGRFFRVGSGENKKSMGYVGNIAQFLAELVQHAGGVHVYNYADSPDLTTNEIIRIALDELGRTELPPRIPYVAALLAGYAFDVLAFVTRRELPISAIRVQKFCANTQIDASAVRATGFRAPFSLEDGLRRMIRSEFKS